MGGTNQATCPPPAKTSKSRTAGNQTNPVRFHEVTSRGEIDFHDDKAGLKCAVDSATLFSAYNKWRNAGMAEDLILSGNDGSRGHASVTLIPYVDDQGKMQVSMTVAKAQIGKTVLDLDKLAHFS